MPGALSGRTEASLLGIGAAFWVVGARVGEDEADRRVEVMILETLQVVKHHHCSLVHVRCIVRQ